MVIGTIKRVRKKFGGTKNGYKDHQVREKKSLMAQKTIISTISREISKLDGTQKNEAQNSCASFFLSSIRNQLKNG
ncbi:hypothetical protein [Metabacillus indicus]|uniref:Uncharacterized protein n=1 Tax=Metabacillus indicus TaxID=246786 RepID=A0A084GJQ8_METID|nr:hypothetical protein [Metabacillus indicus]KEZ47570.1 hypothetical protein GS18_0219500 [Metabacillus indicus]